MPKLRPRARIIRTIGDQLISGSEAALIELVKNSFDADSPFVNIKIIPPSAPEPQGLILVSDEGHGMTHESIVDSWFEPATDDKLLRRISPGGRYMLGAKGIGRFAAARLGRFTRVESVYAANQRRSLVTVVIDWDWFTSRKYLDEIDIAVVEETLPHTSTRVPGVALYIRDLRDTWTQKSLEALIRELRRVASPVGTREQKFAIRLDITAFTRNVYGFNGHDLLANGNLPSAFSEGEDADDPLLIRPFGLQEHADYILDGNFDAHGQFTGTFTVQRGDDLPQDIAVPAAASVSAEENCGPFSLHINIYDRENEALAGLFIRMGLDLNRIGLLNARRILTENAGISIFRKDFRIRPYGEPENDWLELERQRVQDPSRKLGISQVAGFVQVGDEGSSHLIERSSREGLEHNGAFDRLKVLIQNVFIHAEARRFAFREKAGVSRKMLGNLDNLKQAASLRRVAQVAKKLPKEYRDKVEEAINQDSADLVEELKQIDDYQQILQSRASLGLVLAEVLHEGRRILNPIASSAKAIVDGSEWVLESTKRGDVYRRQFPDNARTIDSGVRDIAKLFKKLDPISGRRRGKPGKLMVGQTVRRSLDLFEDTISKTVIQVNVSGDKSITAFGYEDDLQAALMNIVDNALFWLATVDQPRTLHIDVAGSGDNVRIALANNGPAISESYVDRLFDAGFTLKSAGTGLGLAIAREAMRRSKGDVMFDRDCEQVRFFITIPSHES